MGHKREKYESMQNKFTLYAWRSNTREPVGKARENYKENQVSKGSLLLLITEIRDFSLTIEINYHLHTTLDYVEFYTS